MAIGSPTPPPPDSTTPPPSSTPSPPRGKPAELDTPRQWQWPRSLTVVRWTLDVGDISQALSLDPGTETLTLAVGAPTPPTAGATVMVTIEASLTGRSDSIWAPIWQRSSDTLPAITTLPVYPWLRCRVAWADPQLPGPAGLSVTLELAMRGGGGVP